MIQNRKVETTERIINIFADLLMLIPGIVLNVLLRAVWGGDLMGRYKLKLRVCPVCGGISNRNRTYCSLKCRDKFVDRRINFFNSLGNCIGVMNQISYNVFTGHPAISTYFIKGGRK